MGCPKPGAGARRKGVWAARGLQHSDDGRLGVKGTWNSQERHWQLQGGLLSWALPGQAGQGPTEERRASWGGESRDLGSKQSERGWASSRCPAQASQGLPCPGGRTASSWSRRHRQIGGSASRRLWYVREGDWCLDAAGWGAHTCGSVWTQVGRTLVDRASQAAVVMFGDGAQ